MEQASLPIPAAMSETQRQIIAHIVMTAENALSDLGQNASNGPKARPTVAQLNRTIERLASIGKLGREALS